MYTALQMSKYLIPKIGSKANENVDDYDFDRWLAKTIKYIKVYIDKDFDEEIFKEWLQEGGDEPFIFGKNRYYW